MTEPTRERLITNLERAASTKEVQETEWLRLEDLNEEGDAGKTERDVAWQEYRTALDLAERCSLLVVRRDTRDGVI